MIILGIDPGPKESTLVISEGFGVHQAGVYPNDQLLGLLRDGRWFQPSRPVDAVAIELPRSNFRPVSNDFLDMCIWVGRWQEAIRVHDVVLTLIPYRDIAQALTGNGAVQERFTRAQLRERFGEVGTVKKPGPMWLMKGLGEHVWSALAVAVVAADRLKERREG